MGKIDLLEFDTLSNFDSGQMGAASTTNTSVTEEVKPNPIGFIWKVEDKSNGS